jgi:hypothetical protein
MNPTRVLLRLRAFAAWTDDQCRPFRRHLICIGNVGQVYGHDAARFTHWRTLRSSSAPQQAAPVVGVVPTYSSSGNATSRFLLRTLSILCLLTGHMFSASSLHGTSKARSSAEQEPDDQDGELPHRKYIPHLLDLIASGTIDPVKILTKIEPMQEAIEAYEAFDFREPGWLKVELKPRPPDRKLPPPCSGRSVQQRPAPPMRCGYRRILVTERGQAAA